MNFDRNRVAKLFVHLLKVDLELYSAHTVRTVEDKVPLVPGGGFTANKGGEMMEIIDPGVIEITLLYMFVCVCVACKAQLIASLSQPVELRGGHYTVVYWLYSDQGYSLADCFA